MNSDIDPNHRPEPFEQDPNTRTGSGAQTWVEVYAGAIRQNIATLRQHLNTGVQIEPQLMVVVKANAYGLGLAVTSKILAGEKVAWFGVTSMEEADELVQAGIGLEGERILAFAPVVGPQAARQAVEKGVRLTICDETHLRLAASAAKITGITSFVHLKVNTGMNRLGLDPEQAFAVAKAAAHCEGVALEGVYTHFSRSPDRSPVPTLLQAAVFNDFCEQVVSATGLGVIRHAANSAAALRFPETRMDMVRLGTVVYGQYPSKHVPRLSGLQSQTMDVKTTVVFVRDLNARAAVGYGAQTRLRHKTRAAVVPVGFADGFSMKPSSLTAGWRGLRSLVRAFGREQQEHVVIDGFRAPVLGRVAMQMTVVDVTDAPRPVNVGDIVSVPMRRLSVNPCLPRVVIDPKASV